MSPSTFWVWGGLLGVGRCPALPGATPGPVLRGHAQRGRWGPYIAGINPSCIQPAISLAPRVCSVCICVCACVCTCACVCMYMCVHVCVCMCDVHIHSVPGAKGQASQRPYLVPEAGRELLATYGRCAHTSLSLTQVSRPGRRAFSTPTLLQAAASFLRPHRLSRPCCCIVCLTSNETFKSSFSAILELPKIRRAY